MVDGKCLECDKNYKVMNNLCVQNDGSCLDWEPTGECKRCERGFSLINGRCEVKDSKCKKYNAENKC